MLPKLLFLHGSGTNSVIFRIQARKLVALLQPHFELVFLDGPIECPAGPGVLPFFEGVEPFRKWILDSKLGEEEDEWSGLDSLLAEVRKRGPFVGVVGFSQGCKAALHLVRQLENEKRGVSSIEFVVNFGGTAPFQGVRDMPGDSRSRRFEKSLGQGLVRAESMHVIGEKDPWGAESEALVMFFEEAGRRVVRFDGGHHMPVEDGVNRQIVQWMLSSYQGL